MHFESPRANQMAKHRISDKSGSKAIKPSFNLKKEKIYNIDANGYCRYGYLEWIQLFHQKDMMIIQQFDIDMIKNNR